MTLISGPEIKIAWMIGDGLEKGFVSWWLDVRKNLEHHAEFTYY